MKIHEIISEAGILQSLGTGILKGLGNLVGRGATWRTAEELAPDIAKQMSRLRRTLTDDEVAKIVKNSSESVQEALEKALERKMAADPRITRLTRAEQDAVIAAHPNPDPKLIKEIQKKADKLVKDIEWEKAKAPFKGLLKNTGEWIERFRKLAMYPIIGMMFASPLITYRRNMEAAEKHLAADTATAEDFESYHRQEMSVLIGKWAAVFTAGTIGKLPVGVVSVVISKLGAPGLALLLSRYVGTPAAITAMGIVSRPDVAQSIANFMASNVFGQAVGYLGIRSEDAILGMFSEKLKYGSTAATGTAAGASTDSGQGAKPDANAAADIGSSSQPPSGTGQPSKAAADSEYDRPLFKGFK